MASVLTNFLVGIGFDVDNRSFDQATSSIDKLGSVTKGVAASVAGAFGMKALTTDLASATAQAGRFGEVFGVIPQDLKSLGMVMEDFGGGIDTAMSDLETVERLRTMTEDKLGGLFSAAGIAGFDASVITDAKSATDAYKALADVLDGMSQKERLQLQGVIGISDTSLLLLSEGRDELERLMSVEAERRPLTQQQIEDSKRLNAEMADFYNNVGAVSDQIGAALIPALAGIVGGVNGFIEANRELISGGLNEFLTMATENLDLLLVGLGVLGAAKTLSSLKLLKDVASIGAGRDVPQLGDKNGHDKSEHDKNGRKVGFSIMDLASSARLLGVGAILGGVMEDNPKFIEQAIYSVKKPFEQASAVLGFGGDPNLEPSMPSGITMKGDIPSWGGDAFPLEKGVEQLVEGGAFPLEKESPKVSDGNVFPLETVALETVTQADISASISQPPTPPAQSQQAQSVPINVTVQSQIDGQILDERTVSVMGQMFNTAQDDLSTSTRG